MEAFPTLRTQLQTATDEQPSNPIMAGAQSSFPGHLDSDAMVRSRPPRRPPPLRLIIYRYWGVLRVGLHFSRLFEAGTLVLVTSVFLGGTQSFFI